MQRGEKQGESCGDTEWWREEENWVSPSCLSYSVLPHGASLILKNPILGNRPEIQRQKREGTLHVYYDKIFPRVIAELTACLLSECLIIDPSELILLTSPVRCTKAQRYSSIVIISKCPSQTLTYFVTFFFMLLNIFVQKYRVKW